jgi:hypothetical protein
MSYQSSILFEARTLGRFTWWDVHNRMPHLSATTVAGALRILGKKGLLSVTKANRMSEPVYEITSAGRTESDPDPSHFRLTIKKIPGTVYYTIVNIETNIRERVGRVIATVWNGTAARGCEFRKGDRLNRWQAAQQLNDRSITLIGIEDEDKKYASDSFYNSDFYPNR